MEGNEKKVILLNIKVCFFGKTQQCLTAKEVLGEILTERGNSRAGILEKNMILYDFSSVQTII